MLSTIYLQRTVEWYNRKMLLRFLLGGWELLRQQMRIDDMQFGFMPGRSTIDAIFIVRQLQENVYTANKTLYMAFVDLEMAFDRLPKSVIWLALPKLDFDEWLVLLIESMYENARSRVRFGCNLSEKFSVKVGLHQGYCLNPFLVITEAPSQEFRTGCPWENLYADDLVVITESLDELQQNLILWTTNTGGKGRRINMGKIMVLISGLRINVPQSLAKTSAAWVSRASAQIPFPVVLVPVGSTRDTVASLAVWSLMPALGVNGTLGRPD